ncbi:MAG: hypothetical protein E6Q97_04765 [Desulfurellales bacterium]|nr:MAG: hypothetical protein E6Q97_04765 [Desulfurellales bacterium]
MKLLPDWRRVLEKAWSIKFMLLAGLLSGCEVVMSILEPSNTLPAGVFAALAGVVTSLALVARLMAQNEADHDADDQQK